MAYLIVLYDNCNPIDIYTQTHKPSNILIINIVIIYKC